MSNILLILHPIQLKALHEVSTSTLDNFGGTDFCIGVLMKFGLGPFIVVHRLPSIFFTISFYDVLTSVSLTVMNMFQNNYFFTAAHQDESLTNYVPAHEL